MRRALLIAAAALGLTGALVARVPLSMALDLAGARGAGLDWRAAEGPVWGGVVHGLSLYDYPLGEARIALSPASLLTASPSVQVSLAGPEGQASARVTRPLGGGLRVSDANATMRLSELSAVDPRLRTRGGAFTARDLVVVLGPDGACRRASGTLHADALTHGFEGQWRGPELAGAAACEDGVVVMSLAGAEEGQAVQAAARLGGGAYSVEAVLNTSDEDVARVAPVIGFTPHGAGWRYQWRFDP